MISELEEELIPEENNTPDDNQLDDVVPCDTSVFSECQMVREDDVNHYDGLYDENNFVSSVNMSNMVDIAPHKDSASSEYSLEEVFIPEENNTPDDDQLDDIVV